jgi:Tol biopolymer transport system component
VQDVWKLAPGSGGPVRLTTGPGEKWTPNPSPDGGWVSATVIGDKGQYVYVMRHDGSDLHPLQPGLEERFRQVGDGQWAPDGLHLACSVVCRDGKEGLAIATMDPETGTAHNLRLLDLPGESADRATWSPDGRFLAYEAIREGSWDVWIANGDGRNARRLTSDPGNERSPAWSADGKFLYYIRDYHSVWRLPMDASGKPTGPAQLWARFPKTRIDSDAMAFTKDQVILSVTEEASDLWLVELPQS